MVLLEQTLAEYPDKYRRLWQADDESLITADFDSGSAAGSKIVVLSTKAVFTKNSKGQWQKDGTTEVIV